MTTDTTYAKHAWIQIIKLLFLFVFLFCCNLDFKFFNKMSSTVLVYESCALCNESTNTINTCVACRKLVCDDCYSYCDKRSSTDHKCDECVEAAGVALLVCGMSQRRSMQ